MTPSLARASPSRDTSVTNTFPLSSSFARTVFAAVHAVVATSWGGPEVLEWQELPDLEPRVGEVRVRVEAAGVSFADLLMRAGAHPERRRAPFVPGWDFVGRIDRVGPGVTAWRVEDRVAGLSIVGGWAEQLLARADDLVRVPEEIEGATAACLVMDSVVAWQMLHRVAEVRPGCRVLVHGATGGVGTAATQLARLAGAEVFGTAHAGDEAVLEELGCTPLSRDGFVAEMRSRGGADVVLDGVGGWHLLPSIRASKSDGTVVFYGVNAALSEGRAKPVDSLSTWAASAALLALGLLPGLPRVALYSIQRMRAAHPEWFKADLGTLLQMSAERVHRPHVSRTFALSEARLADEALARGERGKFVLLA